jgi:hypothetical protein
MPVLRPPVNWPDGGPGRCGSRAAVLTDGGGEESGGTSAGPTEEVLVSLHAAMAPRDAATTHPEELVTLVRKARPGT